MRRAGTNLRAVGQYGAGCHTFGIMKCGTFHPPRTSDARIQRLLLYSGGSMPENKVMTLRLEPDLRKRLDGLAKAQRRSRSFIAAEAIREYVQVNEWQIEEIKKGLAEAHRGEFANDAQVRRTMNKWTGRKRPRRAG